MRSKKDASAGFTLLEVMIAVMIMVVAFGAILSIQSSAIDATRRTRKIGAVAMLAKRTMVEAELKFEGVGFKEVEKEKSGTFKAPFEQFTWTREVKEIKFPNLKLGQGGGDEDDDKSGGGVKAEVERLNKILANYLSKAMREVTVTVSSAEGKGKQSYTVSTYWVDLNHEFKLSEF